MSFLAHTWRWWRSCRNTVRRFMVDQPVRGFSVIGVVLAVWLLIGGLISALLLMLSGSNYMALKPRLMETLLSLFFFVIFFLVVISDTVVVWSGLFRTRSAAFHAQLPGSDRQLFWSTLVEGGLWASWAVMVLAVPLVGVLVADALITAAEDRHLVPEAWALLSQGNVPPLPAHGGALIREGVGMALGMFAALGAFIATCMSCGALAALLLARLIPALRRGIKGNLLLIGGILLIILAVSFGNMDRRIQPVTFMQDVVGRLSFVENPLLPSWWTQQAVSAAAGGRWGAWAYNVALLISTAAGVAVIAEWYAARRLRRDLDALTGRPDPLRRAQSRAWRLLPFLPADLALLVAKDLRLFLRDPAQILQFSMFFGLLAFYLLMLPRIGFAYMEDLWWRPIVSGMSLLAVAMALATFTGRFVFPLLSLEGRRLWVLALAPWPRERIVTAKFVFALLVGLPVSVALVILSGIMLNLQVKLVAYEILVMVCMAVGFSASTLGLGARLADYSEDNPAKLVAGYGGTVNLLVTLLFTIIISAGACLPIFFHASFLGRHAWLIGVTWTLAVTTIWTWIFLRQARYWFGRFDLVRFG